MDRGLGEEDPPSPFERRTRGVAVELDVEPGGAGHEVPLELEQPPLVDIEPERRGDVVLRRGGLVGCVENRGYAGSGRWVANGTHDPQVMREVAP